MAVLRLRPSVMRDAKQVVFDFLEDEEVTIGRYSIVLVAVCMSCTPGVMHVIQQ